MKTNRIKRLFTLVMIVLIITGLSIPSSLAAKPSGSIQISNADELQTYFKNPAGKTGILMNDITAPRKKAFVLPQGREAVLDLRGKDIIGAKGSEAITIDGGSLTLRDTYGTGKITHNGGEGRGIFMRSGSLIMEGGNIAQNQRLKGISGNANGGGVYVSHGNFTMKGGTITENMAENGAGVYVDAKGRFIIRGGTITRNLGGNGGGILACNGGVVEIYGGKIYNNTHKYGKYYDL